MPLWPFKKASPESYDKDSIQESLANGYDELGDVYQAKHKPEDAYQQYQKALEIRERLARKNSDNAEWQSSLAFQYVVIADVLASRNAARAMEHYRNALTIRERLAGKYPGNIDWARNVADTHEKLAGLLVKERLFEAALKEYNAALEIRIRHAHKDPDNRDRQREFARAYELVGNTVKAQAESPRGSTRLRRDDRRVSKRVSKSSTSLCVHIPTAVSKARAMTCYGNCVALSKAMGESEPSVEYRPETWGTIRPVSLNREYLGDLTSNAKQRTASGLHCATFGAACRVRPETPLQGRSIERETRLLCPVPTCLRTTRARGLSRHR